jgi:hypothetical protein
MAVRIAGRLIYVNTRGTQAVKVCTPKNKEGVYEKYYRIYPPLTLAQREMEMRISRFSSLADLERWLIDDRKAVREQEKEVPTANLGNAPPSPFPTTSAADDSGDSAHPEESLEETEHGGAVARILDLLSTEKYSPDDDLWLPLAKDLVEQSIDRFLQEFLEYPYLHRREHSIHFQLFSIMMSHQELAQRVPLGDNLAMTQLVHKEWPESVAREENRRGWFDLAVLSPKLLRGCPGIRVFLEGHLQAPIVIEMGLDYDTKHLAEDAEKLINSKPKHGYLIHLVRELPREPATERIILGIEEKCGIKTAYAWRAGGQTAWKHVNDRSISER